MKTVSQTLAAAALAAIAGASLFAATDANAGGHRGREIFIQDYTFDKPMHGYSGHAGNQYCDYQRLPNRQCDANGQNCRIVSWTLREMCQ